MAFKPLTVVTIAEFRERSEELVREVYETGETVFIMDGDVMLGRLLPPEASLDDIRHNLAILDEIEKLAEESKGTWNTNALEMIDEQRRD